MNKHSTFLISRRAAVMLVALVWSSLAFCGEIHEAAKRGDLEKIKLLLKANPELALTKDEKYHWAPMTYAIFNDQKDVVELLLTYKVEVNAKDNDGMTILHLAAQEGYTNIVALLLSKKAEIDSKDNEDRTPLFYAAAMGHKDVVTLLLSNKAEVNSKDKHGATPLSKALEDDEKDVVELLRQHGGKK